MQYITNIHFQHFSKPRGYPIHLHSLSLCQKMLIRGNKKYIKSNPQAFLNILLDQADILNFMSHW